MPASLPAAWRCKLGTLGNKPSHNLETASHSDAETACVQMSNVVGALETQFKDC